MEPRALGPKRFPALVLPLVLALVPLACGGGGGSSGDSAARQLAAANDRLKGEWLLVAFQPQMTLEPIMASLLGAQVNSLVARFDGQRLFVTGVGVQATRTYRVEEADMQRVRLALFDDAGVRYDVRGEFAGGAINFEALTPPWTGRGTLSRRGP